MPCDLSVSVNGRCTFYAKYFVCSIVGNSNTEICCTVVQEISVLLSAIAINNKSGIAVGIDSELAYAIDRVSCLKYKVLFLLEQYIVPVSEDKAFAYNAVFLVKHVVGHIHQSVHIAVRGHSTFRRNAPFVSREYTRLFCQVHKTENAIDNNRNALLLYHQ